MAKAFLYGNGGGAGLNFKLKAYATEAALLADSPADGTVGVVTVTEISGYAFVAATSEITSPATGMVAITEGTASPASYNALKKNMLNVYPTACYQYSGSAWGQKTSYVRKGGAWVSMEKYIFFNGDVYQAVTGGYGSYTWYDQNMVTVTNDGTNLIVSWGSGSGIQGVCATKSKVDLSDYSTLSFEVTLSKAVQSVYFGVRSSQTGSAVSSFAAYAISASTTAQQIVTVDISALSGSYYVVVGGQTNAVMTATISKIGLR